MSGNELIKFRIATVINGIDRSFYGRLPAWFSEKIKEKKAATLTKITLTEMQLDTLRINLDNYLRNLRNEPE